MNPSLSVEERLKKVKDNWRSSTKIVRYFSNIDLRNGHDGLASIAKKAGIFVSELETGEFALFVNRKQTALKMYTQGLLIAHLRLPNGRRINPKTIAMLPNFFNGSEIRYNKALEAVLQKEFPKDLLN